MTKLMLNRNIKRIYINRHVIKANAAPGATKQQPPITVYTRGKTYHGFGIRLFGVSHVVYRPEKPLRCGATVWIETKGALELYP